jgi:hypothetical protein
MELHQCLGWVESRQSETPIRAVLSALLRNFYSYSCMRPSTGTRSMVHSRLGSGLRKVERAGLLM